MSYLLYCITKVNRKSKEIACKKYLYFLYLLSYLFDCDNKILYAQCTISFKDTSFALCHGRHTNVSWVLDYVCTLCHQVK